MSKTCYVVLEAFCSDEYEDPRPELAIIEVTRERLDLMLVRSHAAKLAGLIMEAGIKRVQWFDYSVRWLSTGSSDAPEMDDLWEVVSNHGMQIFPANLPGWLDEALKNWDANPRADAEMLGIWTDAHETLRWTAYSKYGSGRFETSGLELRPIEEYMNA